MNEFFRRFAASASNAAGSPWAFLGAVTSVVAWAAAGPKMKYSDSWMLVVGTFTTIATYLMVFLIQSSQNRDTKAVLLKLDELIRSSQASNELIEIEKAEDKRMEEIRQEIKEEIRRMNDAS